MEKWKKIKGYDGYLVSDKGRVATILNKTSKERGIGRIRLTKDGKRKSVPVKKLVKEAFGEDVEKPKGNDIREWDWYIENKVGPYYVDYARETIPEPDLRIEFYKTIR